MYTALIVLAVLAAIVVALSPRGFQSLYSRLIFAPDVARKGYGNVTLAGIAATDLSIRVSRSRRLHGWYFRNPASDVVIVYSHSNAGNVYYWSDLIEELLATGASVIAYDYEGYGLSEGTPTIRRACRDGLAAYDYAVKECGFKPSKVLVYGSSLGCGVAGHIATRRTIGGLVLHAGFSSLRLVASELLPITRFVPDVLFFRPRMDNVAALRKVTVPLRVVHGQWDEMFGAHHPRAVFDAAASPDKKLTFIAGGSHMTRGAEHQTAIQEIVDLLR